MLMIRQCLQAPQPLGSLFIGNQGACMADDVPLLAGKPSLNLSAAWQSKIIAYICTWHAKHRLQTGCCISKPFWMHLLTAHCSCTGKEVNVSLEYTRKVPINIGEAGIDGATDNKVLSLGTVTIADKDQSGQPRNSNVSLPHCHMKVLFRLRQMTALSMCSSFCCGWSKADALFSACSQCRSHS